MAEKKKGSIATRWDDKPSQYKNSPNKKPTKAELKRLEELKKKHKG